MKLRCDELLGKVEAPIIILLLFEKGFGGNSGLLEAEAEAAKEADAAAAGVEGCTSIL